MVRAGVEREDDGQVLDLVGMGRGRADGLVGAAPSFPELLPPVQGPI